MPYSKLVAQTRARWTIRSFQPLVWFAPNLATAGQTDRALPRTLVGRWPVARLQVNGRTRR